MSRPSRRGIAWLKAIWGTRRTTTDSHSCLTPRASSTEAIAARREAVALEPGEYRYREALAEQLMENKEYDEALTQYTEAAKLAPNEFFAEQMADQQIEIYRRQGTLGEKLEALEGRP